jgi:hypothetical protein
VTSGVQGEGDSLAEAVTGVEPARDQERNRRGSGTRRRSYASASGSSNPMSDEDRFAASLLNARASLSHWSVMSARSYDKPRRGDALAHFGLWQTDGP